MTEAVNIIWILEPNDPNQCEDDDNTIKIYTCPNNKPFVEWMSYINASKFLNENPEVEEFIVTWHNHDIMKNMNFSKAFDTEDWDFQDRILNESLIGSIEYNTDIGFYGFEFPHDF